jgi:hypothetical protein
MSINNQKTEDARNNFLETLNLLDLKKNFDESNKRIGFFFEDIISYILSKKLNNYDNIYSYTNLELGNIEIDIALLTNKVKFVNVEIKTFHVNLKDFRSRIKVLKDNLGAKSKFYLIYPFNSNELSLIKDDLDTPIVNIDNKLPDYKKNWRGHFKDFFSYGLDEDIEIIGLDEIDKVLERLQ